MLASKSYLSEDDAVEYARLMPRRKQGRRNEVASTEYTPWRLTRTTRKSYRVVRWDGDCSVEELERRISHLSKSLDELKRIAATLKAQKAASGA